MPGQAPPDGALQAFWRGEATEAGGQLVLTESRLAHLVPPGLATVAGLDGAADLAAETWAAETWDAVTLLVADRLALRAWAARLDHPDDVRFPLSPDRTQPSAGRSLGAALGRAPVIAVALSGGEGFSPRPTAGVRRPRSLRARRVDGGWLVVWRFDRPVPVAPVLAATARQAVWRDRTDTGPGFGLGHPPAVVRAAAIEPVDARVINPTGFRVAADEPVVDLDRSAPLGEQLVTRLRAHLGVRVEWPVEPDAVLARTVAGLAMSGTPLLSDPSVPTWAADMLGEPVASALTAAVDLTDRVAREEHSLVLRRAALDVFSTTSWRRTTARAAGLPVAEPPSVSIVLATRRADMLDFALRQVARQAGGSAVSSVELVLAPHGFEVTEDEVRRTVGDLPLVLAPQPDDAIFGDVLDDAFRRSSGDVVVKMDDDDWYSRDFVADLLRARAYSGAEVVGMPAEVHYLTEQGVTVRRGHRTECPARFVAGGTMLLDRPLLREVGGFRAVRKYVDAQLLAAVTAAGAAIYRTHGLGYVLRRNPTGHTWQVDADYLLDPARVAGTAEGFAPSRLLDVDPADLP